MALYFRPVSVTKAAPQGPFSRHTRKLIRNPSTRDARSGEAEKRKNVTKRRRNNEGASSLFEGG